MTDKQLMILLISWKRRLVFEIDFARTNIPDSAKKELEPYWEGKRRSELPMLQQMTAIATEKNEWKRTGDFVALAGLIELSDEFEEVIETLKKED